MKYTITGSTTFANQSNRDAARTRLDTALSGISYANFTSTFGVGVANSGTTSITISIDLDGVSDEVAGAALSAVLTALTSANRHTSGHVELNHI